MEFILEALLILICLLFGFMWGIVSQRFFRNSFKEFLGERLKKAEGVIDQQLLEAQAEISTDIARANAEIAEAYKNLADTALDDTKVVDTTLH